MTKFNFSEDLIDQTDPDITDEFCKSKLDKDLVSILNNSGNDLLPPNTSLIELKSVAIQVGYKNPFFNYQTNFILLDFY